MVGLNWLTLLHARKVNGILADEMVRNIDSIVKFSQNN